MHKLVQCLNQVSSRQFSLITNPLKNLCFLAMGELLTEQNCKSGSPSWSCFWGKAVGCHDTSASGKKLLGYSPSRRWVKSGHPQQLSWCFSQAPRSREYKWRNWDMTFSLTGKESTDNEWTSLWLQALLGKKRQILSAMEIKIPHHFILSCHTEQMQCLFFLGLLFRWPYDFWTENPQCRALTQNSLPLAII